MSSRWGLTDLNRSWREAEFREGGARPVGGALPREGGHPEASVGVLGVKFQLQMDDTDASGVHQSLTPLIT